MSTPDSSNWTPLQWRRRLETFGNDDSPIVASGPEGEYDAVCQPGELTDKGRETTLALGQRLRHLYVDQLRFMPKLISNSNMIYLRATPLPRALESVQQCFWGMYPPNARTADFPPPTILTRTPADETLYPNDGNCRRFAQISRAFAQRTAERWNEHDDMKYLTRLLGKWMPANSYGEQRVAIDSKPRLSGIMDTVNATLAHGPQTLLPPEFYDARAATIIDRLAVEEWYSGYTESHEYRMLGIGALMGDIVSRMTGSVEHSGNDGLVEIGGENGHLGQGRGGERDVKLALSGCHDTTLAGVLSSLGAFEGERWPPYTSHIAIELFKKSGLTRTSATALPTQETRTSASDSDPKKRDSRSSWWSSLFGVAKTALDGKAPQAEGINRKPLSSLSPDEKAELESYFVRIRYNDRVMRVPGCAATGKHLAGDESFCTLEAFKAIVDKYTPKSWHRACMQNLGESAFPERPEPAGYE
jgi:acid phosphatase